MDKIRIMRALRRALGGLLRWSGVGIHTGMIEMRSHLLRSILSAAGVLFGVFVMVVMLSLMGGLNNFLDERMGEWVGSVFVESLEAPKEKLAEFSRSPGLRFKDAAYLEENVPAVDLIYKSIERHGDAEAAAGDFHVRLSGVDSVSLDKEFTLNMDMEIKEGRSLGKQDFVNGAPVCLINQAIADRILMKMSGPARDSRSLLGSNIRFQNARFKIVGVFGPKEGEMPRWLRQNVYVPLLAIQKNLTGFNPDPGDLWIKVRDPRNMDGEVFQILSALKAKHRGVEDFEYEKPDHLNDFIGMMNNVGIIMGIIAMISLLSGGLGIMNVTLSSISERVREIGIRKALGATHLQIFVQVVSEASTLCFVGGIIGAALGCIPMAFGDAIKKATQGVLEPLLPPHYIVLVFLIIVFMGIVFGLYPAIKASRLNPIEALRYE